MELIVPYEPSDLERIEIFYEEVGSGEYAASLDYDDPSFLEEVEPAKGLSAADVSLLSQDLDNPVGLEADPTDVAEYEQ